NIIENSWHIFNRIEALETLESLLDRNSDPNMDVVYMALNHPNNYVDILKSKLPSNQDIFNYYLDIYRELKKVIPELIEYKVIQEPSELTHIKDSGWNIGRAAFLARCFYELQYINKEELIAFLD